VVRVGGLPGPLQAGAPGAGAEQAATAARLQMVATQVEARGVRDPRVLDAMRRVERHRFVPESMLGQAYSDWPLVIGHGQTISQPYIVAVMAEAARVRPGSRVLEIGTGSGYQAAVLSLLAGEVDTIELDEPLAQQAAARLDLLGYQNVTVRAGDGFFGWPEEAPFDAIIITAATPEVPPTLVQQLAPGGRIILPLGRNDGQDLVLGTNGPGGLGLRTLGGVAFVPMTGEVRK